MGSEKKRRKKNLEGVFQKNRRKYLIASYLSPMGFAILGGLVTDHERFSDPLFYPWLLTLFVYGYAVFQTWIYWKSLNQKSLGRASSILIIFFLGSMLVSFIASLIAVRVNPVNEFGYIVWADTGAVLLRGVWLMIWKNLFLRLSS